MKLRLLAAISLLTLSLVGPATAGMVTIGDPGCASCFGSVYTLGWNLFGSDAVAGTETYDVSYSVDTTNYNGTAQWIGAIAFNITSDLRDADLISAPGLPGWQLVLGSPVPNGCSQPGGANWVCAYFPGSQDTNGVPGMTSGVTVPGLYSWLFRTTIGAGTLNDTISIQADYDPNLGEITSESSGSVSVPEGGVVELPLLLSGLIGVGFWSRRRLQRTTIS